MLLRGLSRNSLNILMSIVTYANELQVNRRCGNVEGLPKVSCSSVKALTVSFTVDLCFRAERRPRKPEMGERQFVLKLTAAEFAVSRRAIAELGGTMPEDLPTADSIKKLESAEKKRLAAPKAKRKKGDESE